MFSCRGKWTQFPNRYENRFFPATADSFIDTNVDEVSSAEQNFAASVYYEARWNAPFLRHELPPDSLRRLIGTDLCRQLRDRLDGI